MKLADFEPLTEAEQALIDGLGTGHVTVLGDGTLPGPEAGSDRRVDASLIRWLALGAPGDDDVRLHEHGLRIAGVLIVSDGQADPVLGEQSTPGLDLEGCRLARDLVLLNCRFPDTPVLRSAKVQSVILNGAHLPGLQADRLEARGGVFLRGVEAKGEVRLLGARIGGDLSCTSAHFENKGGKALSADGLEAQSSVYLNKVRATGEVRLLGAQIGGVLDCDSGRFENNGGDALTAQGARVTGALFWRQGSRADGLLDLTAAEVGHINDDPACWPKAGDLLLNRCRYGAFTGKGICAPERIRWLDLQATARCGNELWPQPWEHCALVLREMGHVEDSRAVLIAKENRQRAASLSRLRREVSGTWREMLLPLRPLRDWLMGALIAYGHRPLRALWWLAGMWILGAVLFGIAWGDDGFKPNNAFILRSPEWAGCYEDDTRSAEDEDYRWKNEYPSTLECFLDQPEADGYPEFNAALYSLDTLVPVVDLEVQDYWVPDETVAGWARYYLWVHIAAGWFLALLAVAGFSGLVQTRATSE